jgi:hypothetical protein
MVLAGLICFFAMHDVAAGAFAGLSNRVNVGCFAAGQLFVCELA